MHIKKTKQLKFLPIKIVGIICLSSFINVQAEQVLQKRTSFIDTSYLESKEELQDYILDTGDVLNIRFKNRPKKARIEVKGERSKSDISYLEPRKNLDNYILDTGDEIYLNFNNATDFSGTYVIDKDGEVLLPRIKGTYIKGLTLSELKPLLEKRYDEYILSPNIQITIRSFKFIPDGNFQVNEEGEILLPEITTDPDEITRKTFVRGLTKSGLKKLLEERYSKYFISPEVFIDIINYKPIRISIRGEVRSPGLVKFPAYALSNTSTILDNLEQDKVNPKTIENSSSNNLLESTSLDKKSDINEMNISTTLNSQSFSSKKNISINNSSQVTNKIKRQTEYLTTISNAIKIAGGLTSYSDISKIEITRDIPIEKGGGKKRAIVNFLSYITQADDTSDIRLFDGDSIFIPSLRERDESIVPNSILAGLSPKFISVEISGQIENPGTVRIPIEGTLSDAMNLIGPRKPLSGKILLIRYNPDGTILRKSINYSAKSKHGSQQNPYLVSNDLITVKNSILGRTAGTLRSITEPFVGIYTTKELYQNLTDN